MPCCNTAPYKRLQRVLCCPCSYTAHAAKQRTGLYSGVSVNLTHSSVHNTVTTQANYAPPAPRWSTSQRGAAHPARTRYQSHAGRCTGQHSRPIIIRYIRVRTPQTMPARRGQLLPCVDRWQVLTHCQQYRPGAPADGSASQPVQGQSSSRSAAGGAEPLAALAAALFGLSPDS